VVTRAGSAFTPDERPSIAVASDGTLAAIHEPARVTVVELPGCAAFSELAMPTNAVASEVAWIGAPPRLLVVARHPTYTLVHLVDPYGPRTVGELRIDEAVRLAGVAGVHALLLGMTTATVVTASETALSAYSFPARGGSPAVAGAGPDSFIVVVPGAGALDEWDPQARIPKRRVKLERPGTVTSVGSCDRLVWCTWREHPKRIEVLPLPGTTQSKVHHDLPETLGELSAHARSEFVGCVGAETGRIYVIDLDGRRGLRTIGAQGITRPQAVGLVVGRVLGVLVAQAQRPLAFVALDEAPARPAFDTEKSPPLPRAEPPGAIDGPPTTVSLQQPVHVDAKDWRFELVAWLRAGAAAESPPAAAIDQLVARFELASSLRSVVALLYGAYLAGEPGAAPVEVARVAHGWPEALGRGELAARQVVVYEQSRVRLAPHILRILDDAR